MNVLYGHCDNNLQTNATPQKQSKFNESLIRCQGPKQKPWAPSIKYILLLNHNFVCVKNIQLFNCNNVVN